MNLSENASKLFGIEIFDIPHFPASTLYGEPSSTLANNINKRFM